MISLKRKLDAIQAYMVELENIEKEFSKISLITSFSNRKELNHSMSELMDKKQECADVTSTLEQEV
jgi:hypothetical protein